MSGTTNSALIPSTRNSLIVLRHIFCFNKRNNWVFSVITEKRPDSELSACTTVRLQIRATYLDGHISRGKITARHSSVTSTTLSVLGVLSYKLLRNEHCNVHDQYGFALSHPDLPNDTSTTYLIHVVPGLKK